MRRIWRRRGRGFRARDILASFGLIVLLALGTAYFQPDSGQEQGRMSVVDGDTLRFVSRRIRLLGIDAPEMDQTCRQGDVEMVCGRESARYLRELIGSMPVSCELNGHDRYGRDLGRCHVGEVSLNREMVRAGRALAYGAFEAEEALARAERAGLWGMEFETPARFRREQGMAEEPAHAVFDGLRALLHRLTGI